MTCGFWTTSCFLACDSTADRSNSKRMQRWQWRPLRGTVKVVRLQSWWAKSKEAYLKSRIANRTCLTRTEQRRWTMKWIESRLMNIWLQLLFIVVDADSLRQTWFDSQLFLLICFLFVEISQFNQLGSNLLTLNLRYCQSRVHNSQLSWLSHLIFANVWSVITKGSNGHWWFKMSSNFCQFRTLLCER